MLLKLILRTPQRKSKPLSSSIALSILKKILEADPVKRLTPQQILQDPWMQLTEAQAAKVEVFTQHEKSKIVNDFEYYN